MVWYEYADTTAPKYTAVCYDGLTNSSYDTYSLSYADSPENKYIVRNKVNIARAVVEMIDAILI